MSTGIPEKSMKLIINTFNQYKEIDKAVIFGSRSMGNYKNGSDIDIALYGEYITHEIVNRINIELNEVLPIPYYIDLIHYDSLNHNGLKEHIDTYGNIIYSRVKVYYPNVNENE